MISFSNILNTASDFKHFLAPFINITKSAIINSFVFDDTGVSFVKIVRQWEFIIQVLVISLIVMSSFFIYSNLIITRFYNTRTT